jgi:hypothetical protein
MSETQADKVESSDVVSAPKTQRKKSYGRELIKFPHQSQESDRTPVDTYTEEVIGNDSELAQILKLRDLQKKRQMSNPKLKKKDSPREFLAGSIPDTHKVEVRVKEEVKKEVKKDPKGCKTTMKTFGYFSYMSPEETKVAINTPLPLSSLLVNGMTLQDNFVHISTKGSYEIEWQISSVTLSPSVKLMVTQKTTTFPAGVNGTTSGSGLLSLDVGDSLCIRNLGPQITLIGSQTEQSVFLKVVKVA